MAQEMSVEELRRLAGLHKGMTPESWLMDWAAGEIERLRASLHKLTENNVTYWDDQGAVRHDVGETQAEAMAIFREARALLPPNASLSGLPLGKD